MALSTTARNTYGSHTRVYETDLSDEEWALVKANLPPPLPGGRPRTTDLRLVVNAVLYLIKTGCAWRFLPTDFPPYSTVYGYLKSWMKARVWDKFHDFLVEVVRVKEGKNPEPTVAIIDSQTVKASAQVIGSKAYDAGKKIDGNKYHIMVDTFGLLLGLVVLPGNVQDRDGAGVLFRSLPKSYELLSVIYADGAYAGDIAKEHAPADIMIIKRTEPGFKLLPKRWIVERTFAWLSQNKRLVKNYEAFIETTETFIKLAMIRLMLRRIFPS